MKRKFGLPIALIAVLSACQTIDEVPTDRLGQATLRFANGFPAGTVQLLGSGTQVNISVGLIGMQSGAHAVHLHTIGSCESADFTSAGGHLNPHGNEHGANNPKGSHLGDLPNARIGSAGAGTVSTVLRGDRTEVLARIFDTDGTAVVVHEGADDYKTDPSGAAGKRIACGVLTPD